MSRYPGSPFDSIESAQDFVALLSETVADAKLAIDADMHPRNGPPTRRVDALRIAAYNLDKLQLHLRSSLRILNDLRSLRRLLFEERSRTERNPELALATVEGAASTRPIPMPLSRVPANPRPATARARVACISDAPASGGQRPAQKLVIVD